MNYKMIIVLVLLAVMVVFTAQNVTVVEIKFLLWSIQMSRSLLVFILLATGFVVGWFVHGHLKDRTKKSS